MVQSKFSASVQAAELTNKAFVDQMARIKRAYAKRGASAEERKDAAEQIAMLQEERNKITIDTSDEALGQFKKEEPALSEGDLQNQKDSEQKAKPAELRPPSNKETVATKEVPKEKEEEPKEKVSAYAHFNKKTEADLEGVKKEEEVKKEGPDKKRSILGKFTKMIEGGKAKFSAEKGAGDSGRA